MGRVAPEVALIFGIVLATHGLPLLSLLVNPLTALLTAAALASYVFVYTPLKQVSPLALHVGAIPGALPPLIGWASVHGTLSSPAWALFAILFMWQLPHFLAIAIFRREEYARAGHQVLPVVKGVAATKRAIVGYAAVFVGVTLLPYWLGMVSAVYLVLAATERRGLLRLRARRAPRELGRSLGSEAVPRLHAAPRAGDDGVRAERALSAQGARFDNLLTSALAESAQARTTSANTKNGVVKRSRNTAEHNRARPASALPNAPLDVDCPSDRFLAKNDPACATQKSKPAPAWTRLSW